MIVAVPVAVPDRAVIVTLPGATPVTTPEPETVATAALLVDQVTAAFTITFELPSRTVALNVVELPTVTDAVAGATVTLAAVGAVTVTAALPDLPSLTAVIVAVPAATPVTTPVDDTVATDDAPLDQVMARPVRTFPFASLSVAVSVVVCPTAIVAVPGATVTVATGTPLTVSADVPLTPSLDAVIVAVPAATPVTTPFAFTVATAVLLLVHPTTRPVRVLPDASSVFAVSVTVWPTIVEDGDGVTCTAATGTARTVTVADACFPSTDAMITALPGEMPVTMPVLDTLASEGVLLDQITGRPVSDWPLTLRAMALSCTVPPTTMLAVEGLISTAATGSGATVIVACPVAPSLVAVIVAVPVAIAVTTPCPDTVAAALLLDEKLTCLPLNTCPRSSVTSAESCTI